MQYGCAHWGENQGGTDGIFAQFGGESLFTARNYYAFNIWYMGGGATTEANYDANPNQFRRTNADHIFFYVGGGTATVSNLVWRTGNQYCGGKPEVTVDGPHSLLRIDATATPQFSFMKAARTTFNILNGGTLETGRDLRLIETGGNRELVFNVNGGVIRAAQVTNADPGTFGIFGTSTADSKRVTRFNVYEGGVTFDTNGKTVLVACDLVGATGRGIASVTFTDQTCFTKNRSVGAPGAYVYPAVETELPCLTGDFACLMPLYDYAQNCVTNVRVASPGCGYAANKTASVRFYGGDVSTTFNNCFTTTMRDLTSGPLVKTGAGTLVLAATNSYAGATIVSNGVLRLASDRALPAGTVRLCGGSLDATDGAFWPSGLTLDVSGVPTESGTPSILVTNWTSAALPNITGVAAKWHVTKVGTRLRYSRIRGLTFFMR